MPDLAIDLAGPGGGTPAPSVLYEHWDPDAPRETPSAYDERFDDGPGLPTGWAEFDPNTVLAVGVAESFLRFANTTHATTHWRGVSRAVPVEAEWCCYTRVFGIGRRADFVSAGIALTGDIVGSPTTAPFMLQNCAGDYANNRWIVTAQRWTDFDTFNANYNSTTWKGPAAYLGIGYDGADIVQKVSVDGLDWTELNRIAAPFAPARVGVFQLNSSGNDSFALWPWFSVEVRAGACTLGLAPPIGALLTP